MHHFQYENGELYCEDVPVTRVAEKVGTPFYLYSSATLKRHFDVFDDSFKGIRHLTCFSMKSNSSMAILKLFAGMGGGVDIVSGGELYRALKAGVAHEKIVYSGVGKRVEDIEYALRSNILMFNCESRQELHRLNSEAAKLGKRANVSMRVNPDVDPQTHPYISTGLKENKFGVNIRGAMEDYRLAAGLGNLDILGVSCHIGSQLTKISPFVDTIRRLKEFIVALQDAGMVVRYLDIGGGLGITYKDEAPPLPAEYAEAIKKELNGYDITLILEPGRVIVGNAGIMVTKVLYTKKTYEKNFIIVDAAMNDLIRPSLYGAFHGIQEVRQRDRESVKADVVGPICESGDFLAKDREMPAFDQDELIAVMSAGAYGFSMSSTYNSRPRAAEVMVRGNDFYIIRERETYEDLVRGEYIPDFLNGKQ